MKTIKDPDTYLCSDILTIQCHFMSSHSRNHSEKNHVGLRMNDNGGKRRIENDYGTVIIKTLLNVFSSITPFMGGESKPNSCRASQSSSSET